MTSLDEPETVKIPAGWALTPIRRLCDIWSGGTPRKSEAAFWKGNIPWVSGKDLKSPRLNDSIDHISVEGLQTGSRLAPTGAVFVLVRGMGLAKDLPIAVANRPMAFNQDIKALVPRAGLPGSFLRSAIYHAKERLLSRIVPSAHGTMTLNLDDIENLTIGIPSDATEAEAIASILDTAQLASSTEQRQLEATIKFKRAVMYAVFMRGLRSEAQKETEIGPIPHSWEIRAIGDFAHQMQYGLSLRGEVAGSHPILRMNCQQDGKVVLRNLQYVNVDEGTATAFRVKPGDILFNRTNSYELVGRSAIVEEETDAVFASYLVRVSVDPQRLDPRFLNHFLNWEVAQAELKKVASRGVSQANISATKLRGLRIPVPSLREQQDIIAILDTIDRKIDLHRRKRAVLDDLFEALLYKLMTGEVRVADLHLSELEAANAAGVTA